MRYTGFYKSNDNINDDAHALQHFKEELFSNAHSTKVNLWDTLKLNKKYTSFQDVGGRSTTRQSRQEYAYRRFAKYFGNSILDVGCDAGVMREFVNGRYVGVDYYGKPDVRVNLEEDDLPFRKGQFDTVLSIEVLEHLNQLHHTFDELIRVSKSYVIVTLPNCWRQLLGDLLIGRSKKSEYGLPNEKPSDRHKWFFNTEEAEDFIAYQCMKHNLKITEVEYFYNIGDVFSFSVPLMRGNSFYYPPRQNIKDQNLLGQFITVGTMGIEKLLKFLIYSLRTNVRKNIEVINIWFVLEKIT